jgi:eukaryotic-like serine/threonine-protein kinase
MTTGGLGKLTPDRWQRIQEVLDAFDDLPAAARPGLLDATGGEDPELRRQVEALLANDDRLDVLEKPVFPICSENLDGGLLVPRIGPYKLVRELGEGGMGTVFLAVQEEPFRRRVALKLIQPRIDSRDAVRRFHEERQILARIRHPNVAQLYDGGTTPDGRPYFVMEHVEGLPIHEYCDAQRLTTRARLELMLQVCSAVHLAHQKLRVVHRDLKPGNILVTEDGIPKLLDFGIAKELDADPLASEARATSVWVPHYSSPEQLAGLPLTTASDIYSLGVLLYRLLTGRLPYQAADAEPASVRSAIRDQPLKKPSTAVLASDSRVEGGELLRLTPEEISRARGTRPARLSRLLAGDVDAIVLKALATDPEDRYPSVDQLMADVRRHLKHLPIKARRRSFGYVTGKLVRRHRFSLSMAAIILLILTGSVWTIWNLRLQAAMDQALAQQRTIDLLRELFEALGPDQRNPDAPTPKQILDRARVEITGDLRADPELLARFLNDPLAKAYRKLGYNEDAQTALLQALELMPDPSAEDHPLTAELLNNLGAVRFRMGDDPEAERYYRQGLEMRQRLQIPEIELVGSLSNLAATATMNQDFAAAARGYRQVIDVIQRGPAGAADPRLTINYRNLGMLYYFRSELPKAERLLRKALALELAATDPRFAQAAEYRSSLARVLLAEGRPEDAEVQLVEALRVQQQRLGFDHEDLGRSQRNLAAVLLDLGESSTAAVLLDHAQWSLRQARKEPDDWETAELDGLVGAYLAELEDFEAAEPCVIESYETIEAARGGTAIHTRQALQRIIHLYQEWGKSGKAAAYRGILEKASR